VAPQDLGGGLTTPAVNVAPARFDIGVALRLSL
jgi:hypothetical protein